MPCIDESGNLTESATALLKALIDNSLTSKEISSKIGVPIFKVRSSIRELVEAELLVEVGEKYEITDKGLSFT